MEMFPVPDVWGDNEQKRVWNYSWAYTAAVSILKQNDIFCDIITKDLIDSCHQTGLDQPDNVKFGLMDGHTLKDAVNDLINYVKKKTAFSVTKESVRNQWSIVL